MLTASVENMLVTSIDTTLETGLVPTQNIVIISTVRRQSEVGIQRWIDVGPIVNFCLSKRAPVERHLCAWPIRSCLNEGGEQQTGREP